MKRFLIATVCLLAFTNGIFAQQTKTLKVIDNAEQLVKNGVDLTDKGKYEEAIAEFDKVPYGNAEYDYAQYEKSYALSLKEDNLGAVRILEELLKNPSCKVDKANIYTELANCYDNLKQYDKAIMAYDEAIAKYPYYFHLYFNKGVALMRQEKYEEAKNCFKKSIFLNPTHQSSHYQYGMSNLYLGYVVPGIMALNFCTFINPENRYAILSLQEMQQIYESGVDQYLGDNEIIGEQKYVLLDTFYKPTYKILNTDFIHMKQFHAQSKIDNDVAKYNQLVFINAESREGSCEIEDQLYAPLLKSFMTDKQYNLLTYYQFAGTNVDNGKVGAKAEKMNAKGNFKPIIQKIVSYLREAGKKGLGIENKEGYEYVYDEQFKHLSWGKSSGEANGESVREGLWYEVSDNGQLGTVANYRNGVLDGHATVYQDNEVALEMSIKDNRLHGQSIQYTPDPYSHQRIKYSVVNSVNGSYEGAYQQYNRAGVLVEEGQMENGIKKGEIRYYDDQGRLNAVSNLNSDGEPYGSQKTYYPDGTLKTDYKAGGKDEKTPYISYYQDGRVEMEGSFMNGNSVDVLKQFYPNGKLYFVKEYNNEGKPNGKWEYYNRNGVRIGEITYRDGNIESKILYTNNGAPAQIYTYKNGDLTAVAALNADSTVKENYSFKGKTITYKTFDDYGVLDAVITKDAKDQYQGEQEEYYPNGKLKRRYVAVDGKYEGKCVEYYCDGKVKSYGDYKDNMRNGVFINYYDNEKNTIEKECFYRNDTLVGAYYAYDPEGNKTDVYLNDVNGDQIYAANYFPNHQKNWEIWYYNAMPFISIHYGQDGKMLHCDTIFNGNGSLNRYYWNGNVAQTYQCKGGSSIGESILYDFKGKERTREQFVNGSNEGVICLYHPDGTKESEIQMRNGLRNGVTTRYDILTGEKEYEWYMEFDQTQGLSKVYSYLGTITAEVNTEYGEWKGQSMFYSPDGETVLYELYNNVESVKYACRQKNGKMSEPALIGTDPLQITAYYPNGKLGAELSYDDGLRTGNRTIYYADGKIYEKTQFKDNLYDGQHIIYYENGNIRSEYNYVEDMKHGPAKMYYENGQLAREFNYWHDLLHGDYQIYDRTGKLVRKIVMFYDNPIEDIKY